ncbi:MAG: alpha/beta fold hydrolase [Oceanicaulis sp.]
MIGAPWARAACSAALLLLIGLTAAPHAGAAPDNAALFERIDPAWRDFEPVWRQEACPFDPGKLGPDRLACGRVFVPEDRRDPDSRLIGLFVVHLKARLDHGRAPTVYLSGGPGSPASRRAPAIVEQRTWITPTILAQGDLILPDQRGSGYSQARFCRDVGPPSRYGRFGAGPGARAYGAALRACREAARRAGVAVDAYTSWDNALDMRDIRRALGFEQWNVWGVSYGGELAHMVARTDRAGVRALVLDSPAAPGWGGYPEGFAESLEALNTACIAQPGCAARYGDLRAAARRVAEVYAAEPMVLDGLDPRHAQNGALVVDGPTAAFAMFQMLYYRSLLPAFPAMLEAFERRDRALMQALADRLIDQGVDDMTGSGLRAGAACTGWPVGRAGADLSTEAEAWRAVMGANPWKDICAALGLEPDPLHTPARTDAPTLVIFGAADPITPPGSLSRFDAGLAQAQVKILPRASHGASQYGCGAVLIAVFLRDGALAEETCAETGRPQTFITQFRPGGGPYRLYGAATGGSPEAAFVIAGLAALLTAALIAFPGSALFRRIKGAKAAELGRVRVLVCAAAVFGLAGLGALVAAMSATLQTSRVLVPAGLTGPWAWTGPLWILAAAFGAAALIQLVRTRKRRAPFGTRLGAAVTASAAIALAAAGFALDLA